MANTKAEWSDELLKLITANPEQKPRWYAEQLGLTINQVRYWIAYNKRMKEKNESREEESVNISQDDMDRMHEALEKKAITTPEELSAEAAVTVEQAKKYLKNQKMKIQNAVLVDEEAMRQSPIMVNDADSKHEPTKTELLKALEQARKERDEWKQRWKLARRREGSPEYVENMKKHMNELTDQLAAVNGAMQEQVRTVDAAIAQRDDAVQNMSTAIAVKDEMTAQRDALTQENDELRAKLKDASEFDRIQEENETLKTQLSMMDGELNAERELRLEYARRMESERRLTEIERLKLIIADMMIEKWGAV